MDRTTLLYAGLGIGAFYVASAIYSVGYWFHNAIEHHRKYGYGSRPCWYRRERREAWRVAKFGPIAALVALINPSSLWTQGWKFPRKTTWVRLTAA